MAPSLVPPGTSKNEHPMSWQASPYGFQSGESRNYFFVFGDEVHRSISFSIKVGTLFLVGTDMFSSPLSPHSPALSTPLAS